MDLSFTVQTSTLNTNHGQKPLPFCSKKIKIKKRNFKSPINGVHTHHEQILPICTVISIHKSFFNVDVLVSNIIFHDFREISKIVIFMSQEHRFKETLFI